MKPSRVALALAALTLLLSSCRDKDRTFDKERPVATDPDRPGSATLTSSAWTSTDRAIDRIIMTRCARELTCSGVGPDKPYPTTDACVVELRKTTPGMLGPRDCPNGVEGKVLDACLDSIRRASCRDRFDAVDRLQSCGAADLCVRAELPAGVP